MGVGAAGIGSLSVNGVELQEEGISLNWDCPMTPDPPIVDVRVVDVGPSVTLTQCTGSENSNHCTTVSIDVDSIAAEFARIDHDLAEPATQAAQSALKLPAFNDLAQVYSSQAGSDGVPICTHWIDDFFAASLRDGIERHGRVSGSEDERVPLHRTNPQLCSRSDDDGCEASDSLTPGDRLQVGFICGRWTYVRRQSRIRSVASIQGWIETARLYGIFPSLEPVPASERFSSSNPMFMHPLVDAVITSDEARVRTLAANGEDPDGPSQYSGYPLSAALSRGDLEMATTLLAVGADPDEANRKHNVSKMTQLMMVSAINRLGTVRGALTINAGTVAADPVQFAKLLIGAGANIDRRDADGATALFYAVGRNNVDVAELLLTSGADPNIVRTSDGVTPLFAALLGYPPEFDPSMVKLLLHHGADPNVRAGVIEEDDGTTHGGATPLSMAARKGYLTIVRALLENGADPKLPRGDGSLPAEIARKNGFPKIGDLIASYAN
jgi:ankyrin repeat protein